MYLGGVCVWSVYVCGTYVYVYIVYMCVVSVYGV